MYSETKPIGGESMMMVLYVNFNVAINSVIFESPIRSSGFGGMGPDVMTSKPLMVVVLTISLSVLFPIKKLERPASFFIRNEVAIFGLRMSASMMIVLLP